VPKELRLLTFLLAFALLLWAFTMVVAHISFTRVQSFDERVLLWLRNPDDLAVPIGPRWLPSAARSITALGSSTVLLVLSFSVVVYLWLERRHGMAALVVFSTFGGMFLSTTLKSAVGRPRPTVVPHLVPVDSPSFPSGHSLLSAVVYLTLGVVLARVSADRTTKIYFVLLAAVLTCLIGLSRIYVGVHYPTDVFGGWIAGLFWALGCGGIARELQRRQVIKPEE
jgi:undecaprenyl-diphosphatase